MVRLAIVGADPYGLFEAFQTFKALSEQEQAHNKVNLAPPRVDPQHITLDPQSRWLRIPFDPGGLDKLSQFHLRHGTEQAALELEIEPCRTITKGLEVIPYRNRSHKTCMI